MSNKEDVYIKIKKDKREVGHYSTPAFLSEYIAKTLVGLNPQAKKILDPAVGAGELIEYYDRNQFEIDGFDIVKYLNRYDDIKFVHGDFIQKYITNPYYFKKKRYDIIVANPPYGSRSNQYIKKNKEILKESFPGAYYNLWSIFFSTCIDIANEDTLLAFIIPDTILYGSRFQTLRDKIIKECRILKIILCPVDLFWKNGANISTCLLILRKGQINQPLVEFLNRPKSSLDFKDKLQKNDLLKLALENILLKLNDSKTIFTLRIPKEIGKLFYSCRKLKDLYHCGGGISTGNDALFTRRDKSAGFTVPFYQNPSSQRFFGKPNSYLCDNYEEQHHHKTNFIIRNRKLLNNPGIVCSALGRRFSAIYLPKNAVNGINAAIYPPKDEIQWVLAYLNSSLVTYFLKAIISRSNMTTINDIASIPIPDFTEVVKEKLINIVNEIHSELINTVVAIYKIDEIIFETLKISQDSREVIRDYCDDLTHLV